MIIIIIIIQKNYYTTNYNTHTHTHTHAHARTRTHTHTHMHTYARTHKFIRTSKLIMEHIHCTFCSSSLRKALGEGEVHMVDHMHISQLVLDDGPRDLVLWLCGVLHCPLGQVVEGDYLLQHTHSLVERAVSGHRECRNSAGGSHPWSAWLHQGWSCLGALHVYIKKGRERRGEVDVQWGTKWEDTVQSWCQGITIEYICYLWL